MTAPTDQPRSTKVAWICAVITAALGATILFSAEAGINWPIWVTTASISLIVARYSAARRVEVPMLVLCAWATILSFGFALTSSPPFPFLIVLADAMLLGLAVITIGAERWSELSAKLLAAVPFLAPLRVVVAAGQEVAGAPRSVSSPRSRALVRGSLLTIPVVIVLVALLASADPIINWGTNRVASWLPDWSFPPRLIFFVFLLTLTLGANALGIRQSGVRLPQFPSVTGRVSIGITEQRMILSSAAVVLWLFVALQISYLVHPPPAALGTGVTFADFARRGFGELSFAVTIVGAIIIILEYACPVDATARDRRILQRLDFALLIALELILFSAFRRVILYEQAYGFTEARVIAQAYMVVMALALAALAWEIWRGSISVSFGRRVAELALGAFTVLVFWNFQAWIVNRNVDRLTRGGQFDASYLASLSRDATPTLIKRLPEIPQPQRDTISTRLACRRAPADRRWFEWNRSEAAASETLRTWTPPACPTPTKSLSVPPTDD
ncbi:MAG TPA: DUF4173 domain-containing protein [Gemmatimonadaceae bacterium]|nr:DUF4173 domain-containing protein [Gemmatimonadaceae bacterium]